jgi:hypothetical protein
MTTGAANEVILRALRFPIDREAEARERDRGRAVKEVQSLRDERKRAMAKNGI